MMVVLPPTWIGAPRAPFPRISRAEYVTARTWLLLTGIGVLSRMTLKIVSWNAYRAELAGGPEAIQTRTAVRLAGSAVTFLWGNTELSHAYSADIATFLLVLYYAVVGVAAIFVGRARAIRALRQVGLGLAIFAALKAIAKASSLAIGLRVGSYLLAGLFLLAVAYWYRETDREWGIGNRA